MLASRRYCKKCSTVVKSENARRAWKRGNLKKQVPLREVECPVCNSRFMGYRNSVTCSTACRKERLRQRALAFSRSPEGRRKIAQTLLKKNYGITFEDKERMVSEQGGKCPICLSVLSDVSRSHVDHDHKTGKIRAVLCRFCNLGLGAFGDNQDSLASAITYLQKHA
jgi:RNA polymerase subunit RPABC4/transcription elongation factor Spt4